MPRPVQPPAGRERDRLPGAQALLGLRRHRVLVVGLIAAALLNAGCQVFPSARAADQSGATTTAAGEPTTTAAGGPQILTDTCADSQLPPHDGFERAPRCVATDAGEVPVATPAVLISHFPRLARAGRPFQVTLSTRNLVRDRFLKAAEGGYYKEMSVLDQGGIVRGHLHVYVQGLTDGATVPDADATPLEFFRAVEDGGGGAGVSRVAVAVGGLAAGPKRLCVTLGDGSHRVPLMRAAKLAAGIDCVRMFVR
jgi:hypothetical protein